MSSSEQSPDTFEGDGMTPEEAIETLRVYGERTGYHQIVREAMSVLARERERLQRHSSAASQDAVFFRKRMLDAERKRDAAVAERDRLREALRDTLTEIDELGAAYTRLRKTFEPPYIVYIPWSRPAALDALGRAALASEEQA